MTTSELIEQLKTRLPANLASDLVGIFLQIRSDTSTETLERSGPGKFVETVVQILQFLETGQYDQTPKVDDYLRNLEPRTANLPDDLRITLARVARSIYTLRNKRSIAHKGVIDPNICDLRYIYSATQWMLSELVRNLLSTNIETAAKLIESIQVPVSPLVEDFGDKRVVLKTLKAEEELLVLLSHYFPQPVLLSQLQKDMNRRAKSTVSNVITATYNKRYLEGDRMQGFKLTSMGYHRAIEIIKSKLPA